MKPKESVTKMGFRVDALFADFDSLANHMSGPSDKHHFQNPS